VLDVPSAWRPQLVRVAPEVVRLDGRVRIELDMHGTLESVNVDSVSVPAGDGSLLVAPTGSPLLLTLDDGGLETLAVGAHALSVRVSGLISPRGVVRVADASAPAVDAPAALTHDPANDLVLRRG
jgi:hypothetical protein